MVSWSNCCRNAARLGAAAALVALGALGPRALAHEGESHEAAPHPVSIRADAEPSTLRAGRIGKIEVKVDIADGYHVQAHDVGESFYVPTTIAWTAPRGIRVGKTVFPVAEPQKVSFDDKPVALYEKKLETRT